MCDIPLGFDLVLGGFEPVSFPLTSFKREDTKGVVTLRACVLTIQTCNRFSSSARFLAASIDFFTIVS